MVTEKVELGQEEQYLMLTRSLQLREVLGNSYEED